MKALVMFLGSLVLVFLVVLLFAYPEMLLINYIFSPTVLITLFGGAITFWKTVALGFVSAYIFKTGTK